MNKKWIVIYVILLAATIVLGRELMSSIEKFEGENRLSSTKPLAATKQTPKPAPAKPASNAPNAANAPNAQVGPNTAAPAGNVPVDYSIIPQKNLFSETRSNVIPVEPVAPSEPPPLAQKPILVGILNTGKGWRASIIDPASQG